MIKINNIKFSYEDGKEIINIENLHIKDNETVGLIGANGAGKSTLLSIILGINELQSGEIIVDDVVLSKKTLKDIRKKLGMVFQNPDDQLFTASVYDDVSFGPNNHGMTGEEKEKAVNSAMKAVNVDYLKDRPPHKLSGGEKRRVAIATALSMNPKVLLLDEPTSFLDPISRRNVINTLEGLPITKIVATHDLDFVLDVCDRVIILKDGGVYADGGPLELLTNQELLNGCGLELPLCFAHSPMTKYTDIHLQNEEISDETNKKIATMKESISNYDQIAIAFSGGTDSTFLLKIASEVKPSAVTAITVKSPMFSKNEEDYAKEICARDGIKHIEIDAPFETLKPFCHNPSDRCYICKKIMFSLIKEAARENGVSVVFDGTNHDDLGDYRPGMKALEELEISSPLKDAALTKNEIRLLCKEMGIEIWEKPAFACLASRIPYGEEITLEKLSMIEQVEEKLYNMGIKQYRVRHHGDIARIEVGENERAKLFNLEIMTSLNKVVKDVGFKFASLDLGGYKMGNMNKDIEKL